MTKWIAVLIVAVALWGGWELFLYWDKVQHEDEIAEKRKAEAAIVVPEQLAGVAPQLEQGLRAAQEKGATGLKTWLNTYGPMIQDPRKAWIELDYCVAVSANDPAEARRVFAQVKKRTAPTSRVWPRIKQLEKTYE